MKKIFTLFLLAYGTLYAQLGGGSAYAFLNMVPSARVAGQGSNAIANLETDVNFATWNPSLLTPEMSGQVSMSLVDYMSDILLGDVTYARHFDSVGTFFANLRYLNYGDFDRANELGIREGTFTATDMALTIGYGRQLDTNWSVGGNFKFIHSSLDVYASSGIALDLSATYHIPQRRIAIAFVAKNMGFQITPYYTDREPLPFELQLGFSNQFEHLPLRWQITLEQLETWDLRYNDPNDTELDYLTGEVTEDPPGIVNNILRHVVVGAEFTPTKGFNLQFGYSFRKRQELNLDTRRTNAGFSFGVGIKVSKFRINYARNMYHVAGGANQFTIVTDLGDFKKEKKANAESH